MAINKAIEILNNRLANIDKEIAILKTMSECLHLNWQI